MNCKNCEGTDFAEDDITGQLICLVCGAATGIFQGITQSQEFIETRGLRVVGKLQASSDVRPSGVTDLSQNDVNLNQTQSSVDLFADSQIGAERRMKREAPDKYSLPGSDASDADDEVPFFGPDRTSKLTKSYRPWRLSEPFTYIMRYQAEQMAKALNLDPNTQKHFVGTVWRLWLNYLAITGELGEEAWNHASEAPAKAAWRLMQLRRLSVIQRRGTRLEGAVLEGRKSLPSWITNIPYNNGQDDQIVQQRLSHFLWAGWSNLYEPNEGREAKDPFLKPLQRAHAIAAKRYELAKKNKAKLSDRTTKQREGRSSLGEHVSEPNDASLRSRSDNSSSSASDDTSPTEAKHSKSRRSKKGIVLKRGRIRCSVGDEPEEAKDGGTKELAEKSRDSVRNELSPIESLQQEDLVKLLENLDRESNAGSNFSSDAPSAQWKRYLVERLTQSEPWRRLFWRGQLYGQSTSTNLLEHNLALLYYAYLTICPTRKATNPILWPHKDPNFLSTGALAVTSLVTVSDLCELCKERRLTFVNAKNCLPPGMFAIHDQGFLFAMSSYLPPKPETLARVTNQFLHFFGLYQLPRLPIAWLVRKSLLTLGLPDALFSVTRLLISRLHTIIQSSANFVAGPTLVSSIPWTRVFRIEVTAMAFVVIALRLLLRFDDSSEYRLDRIAQFLSCEHFGSQENGDDIPSLRQSFRWILWAAYVESRFKSLLSRKADSTRTLNMPPVLTAQTGSEVAEIETASEFLGDQEFQMGVSAAPGEGTMFRRKFRQAQFITALAAPVREVLTKEYEKYDRPDKGRIIHQPVSSPSSPISSDFASYRPIVLTKADEQGASSPFRKSDLSFILGPNIDPDKLIPEKPSDGVFETPEAEITVIRGWWKELLSSRNEYHPICTGRLDRTVNSKSKRKTRNCSVQELVLPFPVEHLIKTHENRMVDALTGVCFPRNTGPTRSGSRTDKPVNPVNKGNESANASDAWSNQEPSSSIQWLLDLCSTACGLSDVEQLLAEVDCVERLLFPNRSKRTTPRVLDLAFLSCLDLSIDISPSVPPHLT
ncbi:unnamed protein product [Calicophoron daubneyi]|uniref:Rrn7/TAF1B C-terminal cyclin domain-containing protein n=1 Tax=Calicophoron daubneyi TaxID=300641 RepID=A0AAV2TXB5_CALDB